MRIGKRYSYNGHYETTRSARFGYPVSVWTWDMPPINEQILDCVIYLYPTIESAKANQDAGGTGFLLAVQSQVYSDKAYLYAVSNRHVAMEGYPVIGLNTTDGLKDEIDLTVDNWREHPDGDDVAMAHLGTLPAKFKFNYFHQSLFLTEAIIAEHKISPGEECFMIGRFVGHQGKQRNQPSIRFGNISMMPTEPITHYDGKEHLLFLVETRSLSGYSGSPVFVYFYPHRQHIFGDNRRLFFTPTPGPWLLGIDAGSMPLYDPVYVIDENDEIVRDEDTDEPRDSHLIVKSNSGLTGVIPAWRLQGLIDHPDFLMARKAGDKRIAEKRNNKYALKPDVKAGDKEQPFTESSFEDALKQASRKIPESQSKDEGR